MVYPLSEKKKTTKKAVATVGSKIELRNAYESTGNNFFLIN